MRSMIVSVLMVLAAVASAQEYQRCGTRRMRPCPDGYECIDDPRLDGCDGLDRDIPGICVSDKAGDTFCGGFKGVECDDPARECFDDPTDECDPDHGGADCGGICLFPLRA
jgi:hypothetical protein